MRRSSSWRRFGLGLILLVLAIGPFFRGLFFTENIMVAIAVTGVGFAAWAYGRRQDREPLGLPGGPAGWALLALVAAYGLQFFWALYFRGNLDWFLRAVAAWFVFVAIRAENDQQAGRRLGWTLLISQGVIAFLGMLQYVGFFHVLTGLAVFLKIPVRDERLYTSYQYPNTTAAVFVALVLLALGMLVNEENKRRRMALGSLIAVLAAAAFFTFSRGALLIAPFALVALVVGLRLRTALDTLLVFILAGVAPTALLFAPMSRAGEANTWLVGTLLTLGIMVLGALGVLAVDLLQPRVGTKRMAGALVAISILLAVGVSAFVLRDGGQVINRVATRLTDVNLETDNVVGRLQMYRDATVAVLDQPWGYGGSGWERVYRQYQPMYYIARDTHSHLFQTLVDTGFAGAIAWVLSLLIPLWLTFRKRMENPLQWSYLAAAGAVGAHALIDFDLSYLFVWLLLYALLAAALPQPAPNPKEQKGRIWLVPVAGALLVAISAGLLGQAAFRFREAQQQLAANRNKEAGLAVRTAIAFDPLNAAQHRLLGTPESLARAAELDPHNPAIWATLAGLMEKKNDLASAQAASRRVIDLIPARREAYEDYARLTGLRLDAALIQGEQTVALEQARALLELEPILAERMETEKPYRSLSQSPLKVSHLLAVELGKATYLTGDQAQAIKYLTLAGKQEETADAASLWLHAIYARTKSAQTAPKPPTAATQKKPLYQGILKWTTPS